MVWGLLADAAPTQMTKKIIREARIGLKKLMETAIQFLLPLIPLSEEDAGEGSEHQNGVNTIFYIIFSPTLYTIFNTKKEYSFYIPFILIFLNPQLFIYFTNCPYI